MYTHKEVEAALQAYCDYLGYPQNSDTAKHLKDFVFGKLQPEFTIENLRSGKVAMICDGTKDECQKVLNAAFPNDNGDLDNFSFMKTTAHLTRKQHTHYWTCDVHKELPAAPCSVFLSQLPKKWEELQEKANKLKAEIDDYLNSCK